MKWYPLVPILFFCQCTGTGQKQTNKENNIYLHITKRKDDILFEIKGDTVDNEKKSFFLEKLGRKYDPPLENFTLDTLTSNKEGKIIYAHISKNFRYYIFNSNYFANKSIALNDNISDTSIKIVPKYSIEISYADYMKRNGVDFLRFSHKCDNNNHNIEISLNLPPPLDGVTINKEFLYSGNNYGSFGLYAYCNETHILGMQGFKDGKQIIEKEFRFENMRCDSTIIIK